QRLFIVTPFLEDYEFFGRGPLSKFLSKKLSEGANVTMLTMPPEGTNGTKSSFLRKYRLMHLLSTRGVDVLFNRKLHAKVFLFDESEITKACILGSANLTTAAMNERLEIAIFTYNRKVFDEVLAIVYRFMNDPATTIFVQWKRREAAKIRAIVEVE
ncbi:phospholipase D family protein, partial [Dehalococcoidia bacterium]|nr:phospholipase D family protein [Dehalococcoidia bacterium]